MNPKPKISHLEIYKYKPGQSGNKLGRPKSYVTVLKELGYTKPVIATMIAEIMFMTHDEVWKIAKSECTEPVIRKMIAMAFWKAGRSGEYKYVTDLMLILFGRPMPYTQEVPSNENNPPAE